LDRIKPIELDKATLPRVFRGYDPRSVHLLLERSSKEIEAVLTEQKLMRGEIDRLKAELQGYRGMESALKDALLVAQKAADETRANAHKEAELMLESARQGAYEEQHVLAGEVKSLMHQVDALHKERDRFQRQFRVLLEGHLHELDQLFESNIPTTPSEAVISVVSAETPESNETVEEPAAVEA
jgi:cell division initiation protein